MSYITVPIPIWSEAPPLGGCGAASAASVGGSSLVQLSSITVTPQIQPSDIAKKALVDLSGIDPEYWQCTDFVKYLAMCEQKAFRIKGYNVKKGKIVNYPLSYNNRWGPIRRRELAEKLKRLEFWFELQEDRPVTLVTLTSFHEGLSIASAWFELNKSRDKLRKLIFKYFGAVDYFWVVEPHLKTKGQEGYAHYHMVVFADIDNYTRDNSKHMGWVKCKNRKDEDIWELMEGKGIEDKFRDIWSKKYKTGNHTYGLDFAQKKDENKIKHLKNYLQKYLQKGFLLDKWTPGMLKFNAAMWETGFRMYGASKNIRDMMNIHKEEKRNIVWLETKIQEPASTPEGEEYEDERVIWYRQYIPDFIDSDMWLNRDGSIRVVEPEKLFLYDWGRRLSNKLEVPITNYKEMVFRKRKFDEDPYEDFNREFEKRYGR